MLFLNRLLVSALTMSLVFSPAAFAQQPPKILTRDEAVSRITNYIAEDISQGNQYFDTKGNKLGPQDLLTQGMEYYYKPASLPGTLVYRVRSGDVPGANTKTTAVALQDRMGGKTIKSQAFMLDPNASAKQNKLELLRVSQQFDNAVSNYLRIIAKKHDAKPNRQIASVPGAHYGRSNAACIFATAIAIIFVGSVTVAVLSAKNGPMIFMFGVLVAFLGILGISVAEDL